VNGRLGIAALASVLVHAAAAVPFVAAERRAERPHPSLVPLDVMEAPVPPPPPDPTPPPELRPHPGPKPSPHPHAKPKPHPKPKTESPAEPTVSVATADAGVADAGATTAADAPTGDAGAGDAGEAADAGVAAPPFDPAVADLRHAVPPGERVVLILRTDRLRGTPWAEAVQAILAPLPDHRRILDGTGLSLADLFDIFVVASSEPRDVAQTFLAGRAAGDEAALRGVLARPAPGSASPRVVWSPDPLGLRGQRSDARDPRVYLVPDPGWFLLLRPELVPAERPPWLDTLVHIDDETRDEKVLAVVTAADFGAPTVPLPGGAALPAPERVTIAVRLDVRGFIVTGAAVFSSAARARGFRAGVEAAQAAAAASITRRFVLRTVGLDGAAARLTLQDSGERVTFSTSLSAPEALHLLDQAASISRRTFLHEP
jgi:hypothetical protein